MKKKLKEMGYKQEKLGELIGVSQSYVSKMLNNKVSSKNKARELLKVKLSNKDIRTERSEKEKNEL